MIRNLTAGPGIHIANNSFSAPYVNMNAPSAGMMRYNGSNLEVYDGSSWLTLSSSYPQIELDSYVKDAVTWAQKKIAEEQRLKDLAAQHTTVADAVAARDRAEEALRIAVALCDTK